MIKERQWKTAGFRACAWVRRRLFYLKGERAMGADIRIWKSQYKCSSFCGTLFFHPSAVLYPYIKKAPFVCSEAGRGDFF